MYSQDLMPGAEQEHGNSLLLKASQNRAQQSSRAVWAFYQIQTLAFPAFGPAPQLECRTERSASCRAQARQGQELAGVRTAHSSKARIAGKQAPRHFQRAPCGSTGPHDERQEFDRR